MRPDETAGDLLLRVNTKPFEFIHRNVANLIDFGHSTEVQIAYSRFLEVFTAIISSTINAIIFIR